MSAPRRNVDTIVTGLHLRWRGVWQRPNHILSRLARHVPVIVLEEPVAASSELEAVVRAGAVTIVTPHRTQPSTEVADARVVEVVRSLTAGRRPLVWLYTPMMLDLADAFAGAPLVYDKMDELAAFAGADRRTAERENALLTRADFTFAGGRSLFRSVRSRAVRACCYPSGVDARHFAQALELAPHPRLRALGSRPIFGYIGVIDERLDLALVADIADARPDALVVMVGPVVKIATQTLPQRPNIVYFGKAEYDELPALLAGFDVALMPFAINVHTHNISPTKTLEYLAAGLPVVSTAVPDVVEDFGDVVRVEVTRQGFVAALRALPPPDAERDRRIQRKVRAATWDAIASGMLDDLASCGIDLTASPERCVTAAGAV